MITPVRTIEGEVVGTRPASRREHITVWRFASPRTPDRETVWTYVRAVGFGLMGGAAAAIALLVELAS